jgi:arylsulfatase A-like enzyme
MSKTNPIHTANPMTNRIARHVTWRIITWAVIGMALIAVFAPIALLPDSIMAAERTQAIQRPNILFAIADDWSFGHAGAYGCDWVETPGFDQVARQGILFTHTFTPNAKCAPSRACLLTGRNSWQLKDAGNHVCYFPAEFKSYPEALAEKGYTVGYTGKGWGPGIANDAEGRPRKIAGQAFQKKKTQPPARAISNNDYAANFEQFRQTVPEGTPWCFWYGALEPHRGYEYGVGVRKAGKKLSDVDRVPEFWPDNETVRNDMLDYAFEVEYFDHHVARILEMLEARGELENTLVVVTSDHGMPFPRCKGQAYDFSNHVPLAIMWPRGIQKSGRTVNDYVSFVDLAPTFIEAAGVQWDETGMQPSPGRSLMDIFTSSRAGQVNPERSYVLIGKERHDIGRPHDWGYPIRGIVRDDMLYVRNYETSRWPAGNPETGYLNCDGSPTKTEVLRARKDPQKKIFWDQCFGKRPDEELYETSGDPDCVKNLATDAAHQALKQQLRDFMQQQLKAQGDPRMFGKGDFFDKVPYANKGQRGFYERYMAGESLNAGWVNATDFEAKPLD